ncbi:hypothetical protein SAMN04487905_12018 [Actinopolyspora xinjiangensis]|uniref:Uncharacterized protein n=1 Tax=Actinopolyspora xinjiangensis TaxID=405564 RepID=A0A1H0X094_9ACTN|nr:hypothetical protein [Actinopolyspora xinjiangensis]SDP96373.1 hypothetical protein SAMN04487905_12018 [Actinopolyspora xinjiangensis]
MPLFRRCRRCSDPSLSPVTPPANSVHREQRLAGKDRRGLVLAELARLCPAYAAGGPFRPVLHLYTPVGELLCRIEHHQRNQLERLLTTPYASHRPPEWSADEIERVVIQLRRLAELDHLDG